MGTLGGFPNPPATSYGEQSSPPLTRSMGPLGGFPNPPATSSGEQSSPPLTRSMGTLGGFPNPPATSSGEQSSPPLTRSMGTLFLALEGTGRARLGRAGWSRLGGSISLLFGWVRAR